jgi:hypothetical protein
MKHTYAILQYLGTHEQLVEDLGNLYYDAMANFLKLCSEKLARDAVADHGRGRPRLAAELEACSRHMAAAARHIESAWVICKPHVSVDSQNEPDETSKDVQ